MDNTTNSSPSDSYPNVSGGSHPGPSPTHDSLLTRAEDLSKQLRNRKTFSYRKNKRSSQCSIKEIQKGLVVVDCQSDAASTSCITEKEKLYDGSMTYRSDMTKSDTRSEIVRLIKQKKQHTSYNSLIPKISILFGV